MTAKGLQIEDIGSTTTWDGRSKRVMQESPDKSPGVLPLELFEAVLTAEADQQYLESLDKLLSDSRGLL